MASAPAKRAETAGPLRTQPQLRFHLTIEGNTTMDTRIADQPAFRLVGHAARVLLIHHGPNPHIEAHIASLPETEHSRLGTEQHGTGRTASGERRR